MNTFKHDMKNLFFNKLQKKDNSIFIYYWLNDLTLLLPTQGAYGKGQDTKIDEIF